MTKLYVLVLCWPLLLPPPAAPASPSCSRCSSSSITIESSSCRLLPSSCRRVVHHRQVAITPSIVVHHRCARSPSPSHSRRSLLSIPVKSPLSSPSPSIAIESITIEWLSSQPLPSIAVHCHPPFIAVDEPSIGVHCHQSVHCCPANTLSIAVESIAAESPSRRQLPSIVIHRPSLFSRRCIVHCCPCHQHQAVYRRRIVIAPSTVHCRPASLTNVLSIAATLSIAVELSIAVAPSIAVSHPAGCCVAAQHANTSHPPVEELPCGMFNLFLMRGTIL